MADSLSSWQFGLEQSRLPRDKVIYVSKICQELNKPKGRFQNKSTTCIKTWTLEEYFLLKKKKKHYL